MTSSISSVGGADYEKTAERLASLEVFHKDSSAKNPINLLLIHGFESSKETWLPIFKSLEGSYNLHAIDLRGHGESPMGNGDFSTEQMVADVHQYVIAKKLNSFVLIGHSMGSRVATPFAAAYPEKIQGLVIEDLEVLPRSMVDLSPAEIAHLQAFKPSHPNLESVQNELAAYGYPPEKLALWIEQGRIRQLEDNTYQIGVHPHVSYQCANSLLASEASLNAFKALNKTEFPILLLKAEEDSSVSEQGLEQMKKLLPRMSVIKVDGSTHSIHKTATSLFISYIEKFAQNMD